MSYRADKLEITHTHTHSGNDNTCGPKLASGKNPATATLTHARNVTTMRKKILPNSQSTSPAEKAVYPLPKRQFSPRRPSRNRNRPTWAPPPEWITWPIQAYAKTITTAGCFESQKDSAWNFCIQHRSPAYLPKFYLPLNLKYKTHHFI